MSTKTLINTGQLYPILKIFSREAMFGVSKIIFSKIVKFSKYKNLRNFQCSQIFYELKNKLVTLVGVKDSLILLCESL